MHPFFQKTKDKYIPFAGCSGWRGSEIWQVASWRPPAEGKRQAAGWRDAQRRGATPTAAGATAHTEREARPTAQGLSGTHTTLNQAKPEYINVLHIVNLTSVFEYKSL